MPPSGAQRRKRKREKQKQSVKPQHRVMSDLHTSVWASYDRIQWMRDLREDIFEQYSGECGDSEYDSDNTLMNLMHRNMVALSANVVGGLAEATVEPINDPTLEGVGEVVSQFLTRRSRALNFNDTMEVCFLDALAGPAIIKVGIGPSNMAVPDYDGHSSHDPGTLYADRISPNDYLPDTSVPERDRMNFEGHRYVERRGDILDAGILDEEAVQQLPEKGEDKDSRGRRSSQTRDQNVNRLADYVELIDLWVAPNVIGREAMIVTLPGQKRSGYPFEPLHMREYEGPEGGDYTVLGFHPRPDNVTYAPPAGFWMRLAEITNEFLYKVYKNEAAHMKGIAVDPTADDKQVDAILEARDRFVFRMPQGLAQNFEIGGASPNSAAALQMFQNKAADIMLNSDALTGTGSSGDKTATEFAGLTQRLGVIVGFMEGKLNEFGSEVMRKMFWYLRQDTTIDEVAHLQVQGVGKIPIEINREFFDQFDMDQMTFRIRHGTMRRKTPETEFNETLQAVGTVAPMAAQLAAIPGFDAIGFMSSMLKKKMDPADIRQWFSGPTTEHGVAQNAALNQQVKQLAQTAQQTSPFATPASSDGGQQQEFRNPAQGPAPQPTGA